MGRRKKIARQWCYEDYDMDSILFHYECEIYHLVDFLMRDRDRLCDLVLEARSQANTFAVGDEIPYPMTAENLYDGSYDGRPAMLRYLELFRPNELNEC
jgi:hypothetical protein